MNELHGKAPLHSFARPPRLRDTTWSLGHSVSLSRSAQCTIVSGAGADAVCLESDLSVVYYYTPSVLVQHPPAEWVLVNRSCLGSCTVLLHSSWVGRRDHVRVVAHRTPQRHSYIQLEFCPSQHTARCPTRGLDRYSGSRFRLTRHRYVSPSWDLGTLAV